MRKYLILLLLPLLVYSCGTASKVNRADQPWSYEVESMGVGADGTYVLRVWTYWRTPDLPVEEAKKNAVHAVIFRGIPAGNGATAQPALRSAELTPEETVFFDSFFQSGYQRFIGSVNSAIQVTQTGRKEYRIAVTMSVTKDNLRKFLEEKGMIKSLSSGF